MKRLLVAAVAVPLALLATFKLPSWAFFVFLLLFFVPASLEYVKLLKPLAPTAPLWVVPFAIAPVAAAFYWALVAHDRALPTDAWVLAASVLATVGVGTLLLLGRTPPAERAAPAGAVGLAAQRLGPWLLFLLYATVWLGATAAYCVGSAWGRHKMAPKVSP